MFVVNENSKMCKVNLVYYFRLVDISSIAFEGNCFYSRNWLYFVQLLVLFLLEYNNSSSKPRLADNSFISISCWFLSNRGVEGPVAFKTSFVYLTHLIQLTGVNFKITILLITTCLAVYQVNKLGFLWVLVTLVLRY